MQKKPIENTTIFCNTTKGVRPSAESPMRRRMPPRHGRKLVGKGFAFGHDLAAVAA